MTDDAFEERMVAVVGDEFADAEETTVEAVAAAAAEYRADAESERPPEKWVALLEEADGDLAGRWNEVVEYVTMHFGPDPEPYTL